MSKRKENDSKDTQNNQNKKVKTNDFTEEFSLIHKILRHVDNYGSSVCFDEAQDLPQTFGLTIESYGSIYIPFTDNQAQEALKYFSKYQDSLYEIEKAKMSISNQKVNIGFNSLNEKLKKNLGCSDSIKLNLEKLLLFEMGSTLTRQRLDLGAKRQFGVLLLQLPSVFTGGQMTVYEDDKQHVYDFGIESNTAEFACNYAAFYSDLELEFQPLTSGSRLMLVYSICWESDENRSFLYSRDSLKVLKETLIKLVQPDVKIGIELSNAYPHYSFNKKGLSALTEMDFKRFNLIKEVNDQATDEHRFAFSFAIIEHNCIYRDEEIFHNILCWLDADGYPMFQERRVTSDYLNVIMDPSFEIPYQLTTDGKTKARNKNEEIGRKFVLVMWPKKYENRVFVKMDLNAYIRSTYKALLCDLDANFDEAEENLRLILNEIVQDKDNVIRMEHSHIYNLLESLKFIMDDEMTTKFLSSNAFRVVYDSSDSLLDSDNLIQLVQEFSLDKLKESFLQLMQPVNKRNVFKNCKLVKMFYQMGFNDFAIDCFNKYVFSLLSEPLYIYFNDISPNNHMKNLHTVFQTLTLFKNTSEWVLLKDSMTKLMFRPGLDNALLNLEYAKMLDNFEDYELSYRCLKNGIFDLFKNEESINQIIKNINLPLNIIVFIAGEIRKYDEDLATIVKIVLSKIDYKQISSLINSLSAEDEQIRKNPAIKLIFQHKIQIYQAKADSFPRLGWEMPKASFQYYPEVERFFKSNQKTLEYRHNWSSITLARSFAKRYRGINVSMGYSARMEARGSGRSSHVFIEKTYDYAYKTKEYKEYYEDKLNKLRRLIE